jgi:hypothetical protein
VNTLSTFHRHTPRFDPSTRVLIGLLVAAGALVLAVPPVRGEAPAGESSAPVSDGPPGGRDAGDTRATEEPYFFYRALPYGSESLVHPLRIIINGGFGITSFDNRDNRLDAVDYRTGWRNVWKNLLDPIGAIEANGWGDFVERELLPMSVSTKKAHYWPNYTLHVVGGGMSYRLAAEWFRYHGYPYPKTLSIATMVAYHMVNEVVENDDFEGYSTDAVADLYLFDPLGIVLFNFDSVSRFFAETLNMAEWSYQAAYDPRRNALENHGQNFAMKVGLGGARWSLFYHLGTHGELGLSYRRINGESFSFGFGGQAKDIFALKDGVRSLDLAPSVGFFYDRNNSLLASLVLSRREDAQVRLNVYPGVVPFARFSPGFIFAMDRDRDVQIGISIDASPVFPLGLLTGF